MWSHTEVLDENKVWALCTFALDSWSKFLFSLSSSSKKFTFILSFGFSCCAVHSDGRLEFFRMAGTNPGVLILLLVMDNCSDNGTIFGFFLSLVLFPLLWDVPWFGLLEISRKLLSLLLSDNEVGSLGFFETGTNSCSLSSSFCLLAIHLLLGLSVFRVSADGALTSVVVRRLSVLWLSSFLLPLEVSVSSNMTLFISVAAVFLWIFCLVVVALGSLSAWVLFLVCATGAILQWGRWVFSLLKGFPQYGHSSKWEQKKIKELSDITGLDQKGWNRVGWRK